ncbi:MAG: NAD(P)/FAD-dependent oxidoreductase [Chloroflexota bacterium]|nr:MAG: FAD-dependent oxidoreductase [Chloroflexota bacterium]
MKDYAGTSFWLETCGDDLTPRPSLDGSVDVDVAILGAGYSGLWTAYYLLRREPSMRIAIVESEIAGFGASGRNGAWCTSSFPVSAQVLAERFGRERTRCVEFAMRDTVNEVARVCEAENIDAHFRKGGALEIARGRHEVPLIEAEYAAYESLDLADGYALLDRQELEERICVQDGQGALFVRDCATIHPGRLVRGLARAVERHGAAIFERTQVTGYSAGPRPVLHTNQGDVRAGTVVLAGEAYLSRLRPLHRQILPVYSLIVLTEPLTETQWREIGWRDHECVSSNKYVIDYLSRTVDGRILFGSRGEPYHFGSRIEDSCDRHEPTHKAIKGQVVEWFPMLRGVHFTHTWGGPVGMPRDFMPSVRYERETGVATARGYTGQGVATTNLAGRCLADLITGISSPLTELPMAGHRSRDWEPEPFRWLAVRSMQWAYEGIDARAARTGRAPSGRSLPERLGRH